MLPKISFNQMSIDEVVNVLSWTIFSDSGPLPLSKAVYQVYPELKKQINDSMKNWEYRDICDFIKPIITSKYESDNLKNQTLPVKYSEIWNTYNNQFMKLLSDYFELEWPDDCKNIECNIGLIPVCPRYIEQRKFEICPQTEQQLIDTCMHECCHFLFFEKCKQLFLEWKWEDFDSPSMLWYLSEIVVDPILNNKNFQSLFKHQFRCYDSFYNVEIEDNNLVDFIREIYESNNINDAIKKSYDFIKKYELSIKKQCGDNSQNKRYITPTLETDRLILRRGVFGDYKKVYEYDFRKLRNINNEFEMIQQNLGNLKGIDTYADEEDEVFDWIIYLKENGMPIGNITADREDKTLKATEIAFNLHPDFWKMGYMSESIIKVLEFIFEYGFENILCGYSEGNLNSKKIGDKIGFEPFSTIADAWEKDGISITDYKTIMSKEKFKERYKHKHK